MATIDETTPLVAGPEGRRRSYVHGNVNAVAEVPVRNSVDSPLDWSPGFKWGIVALLAYSAFTEPLQCRVHAESCTEQSSNSYHPS